MTYSRATRLRRKSSPTRRSSDLDGALRPGALPEPAPDRARSPGRDADARGARGDVRRRDRHAAGRGARDGDPAPDRKSTRLNSSHGYISYAVFCLKKKKEYAIAG